jgi:anti-sigma factor RsiW
MTPKVTEFALHAWLDRELPPGRIAAVEAYLAQNPAERQRLDAYRADGEALARTFSFDARRHRIASPSSCL